MPDNVHDLHGRASKRPPRPEIRPDAVVPEPPKDMTPRARSIWRYLAPELERSALLTRRDRESFRFLCEAAAAAAEALLQMRPDKRKNVIVVEIDEGHAGRLRRHPAWIVHTQAAAEYRAWCKEFGLTPQSRMRLEPGGAPPPLDDDDDDDDLFDT